jgi:hypothetical protein
MTETTATVVNAAQRLLNNPWHHMKGIQRHLRIEGKILPKHRLLRPFYHEYPKRLDDKKYVIPSLSSLKGGLHFFYGGLYMIAGTAVVGWTATSFREEIALWVVLCCLAIAIPAHIYGRNLKQDRFITYDRERGVVRLEYGWFRLKYREIPFWESEGYLVNSPNHMGLMRPTLHLQHPSKGSFVIVEGAEYDLPLGYWSFLIQYMDKSKPMPDVPWLEDYPNKEPGLGDYESWKEKLKKDEIVDPYAVWLTELALHPEWDVGNYGRDLSKDKKYGNLIIWGSVIGFITFVMVSVAIFYELTH